MLWFVFSSFVLTVIASLWEREHLQTVLVGPVVWNAMVTEYLED